MYSRTSKKTILGTEAECVGSVCFGQGKGDIYVRGGFWLFRIRPKRQAGVNYRGSKGGVRKLVQEEGPADCDRQEEKRRDP